MARELGLSASYLTLLESNQRPVTVRVLLSLVEKFQVDLKDFTADTDQRLSLELMEAFSDPVFYMPRSRPATCRSWSPRSPPSAAPCSTSTKPGAATAADEPGGAGEDATDGPRRSPSLRKR